MTSFFFQALINALRVFVTLPRAHLDIEEIYRFPRNEKSAKFRLCIHTLILYQLYDFIYKNEITSIIILVQFSVNHSKFRGSREIP